MRIDLNKGTTNFSLNPIVLYDISGYISKYNFAYLPKRLVAKSDYNFLSTISHLNMFSIEYIYLYCYLYRITLTSFDLNIYSDNPLYLPKLRSKRANLYSN